MRQNIVANNRVYAKDPVVLRIGSSQWEFPIEGMERCRPGCEWGPPWGHGWLHFPLPLLARPGALVVFFVVRVHNVKLLVRQHGPDGQAEVSQVKAPKERRLASSFFSFKIRDEEAYMNRTVTAKAPLAIMQLLTAPSRSTR